MNPGLIALLILLFPAAGAILLAGRGWRLPRIFTVLVGPGVVWLSFLATLGLLWGQFNTGGCPAGSTYCFTFGSQDITYWTWIKTGTFDVPFGLLIDNL